MRMSKSFTPTLKEVPADAIVASHQLLVRAGYIRQLAAGIYSILPLGQRSILRISAIVREEMNAIGAQEFYLPALNPREVWEESGRWTVMGENMFRLKDRKGADLCLAMTHEEIFTVLARAELRSYRQLPQAWYQIQTKFRDEPRPKSGLLRVRQFTMKDSYSFDLDPAGLDKSFEDHRQAYVRIFGRCGLKTIQVEAHSGAIGGVGLADKNLKVFIDQRLVGLSGLVTGANKDGFHLRHVSVPRDLAHATPVDLRTVNAGESCPRCGSPLAVGKALEVGHIFKLGTRYSESMGARVLDESGKEVPIIMGSYGIGIERILAGAVELHHDADGIRMPMSIAPFHVSLLPLQMQDAAVRDAAEKLYRELTDAGVDVLLDDRDERAGVKFKDGDLIGQ